eukprot:2583757-Rhodomonas_salina.1
MQEDSFVRRFWAVAFDSEGRRNQMRDALFVRGLGAIAFDFAEQLTDLVDVDVVPVLHEHLGPAEIKDQKPLLQYTLYQKCCFSHWISHCSRAQAAPVPAKSNPGSRSPATNCTEKRVDSAAQFNTGDTRVPP